MRNTLGADKVALSGLQGKTHPASKAGMSLRSESVEARGERRTGCGDSMVCAVSAAGVASVTAMRGGTTGRGVAASSGAASAICAGCEIGE